MLRSRVCVGNEVGVPGGEAMSYIDQTIRTVWLHEVEFLPKARP